jgi:uncharacterized protein
MHLEFDPAKNAENIRKHGLSFESFTGFDEPPTAILDDRAPYGEMRVRFFGRIEGKPCCAVATIRGENLRLISLRRAHEKEIRRHERPR